MGVVSIPDGLLNLIRKKGFDPEVFIVDAINSMLKLDPETEVRVRVGIARYMYERAVEEIEKGDSIEASEKLYKVVEECIKVLSCIHGIEECRIAREKGLWWTKLLSRASRKLTRILENNLFINAWSQAYDLHVHGFHERSLEIDDVKQSLNVIKELLEYVEKTVGT